MTKQGPTVHTVTLYPPNTTIAHILLNYPHRTQAFLTVEGDQYAATRRERPITFLLVEFPNLEFDHFGKVFCHESSKPQGKNSDPS